MKSYDELTLEEKQELLRDGIRKWITKNNEYGYLSTIEQVALLCLSNYVYYYRKSINKPPRTPKRRQDKDILAILKNLPEYFIYQYFGYF